MSGFNKSTHKQKFSAHAVASDQNGVNLKNKPVINSSKNRVYDSDFDFIPLDERPGFAGKLEKARRLLIEASSRATKRKKPDLAYISGVSLRKQIECTPDEWIEILAKLIDETETKGVMIPSYRYSVREVKKLPSRHEKNSEVFDKRGKPKAEFPTEAIAEKYR